MVKLARLLVLSALIVWLAGSGCVGNNTSDVNEAGIAPDIAGAENVVQENSNTGLTQAEIQEIDNDMAQLQILLENATPEDKIVLDEIQK